MTALDDTMQDLVAHLAANAGGTTPTMLGEYIIIATATGIDTDDDPTAQTFMLSSHSPQHRLLGLLEFGRLRMRSMILDNEDEADRGCD